MLRLRFKVVGWTRRALALTDTPRPDCPDCQGDGGTAHDYGDHNGEYAGTEWEPCTCWNENRRWLLMPLPRLPRRDPGRDPWGVGGYSDEPPF
ncbi:hypothetical protein V2E29_28215 [Streptomyces diastatochromogenes]|uniref:hypothetical protein n=1 Tax=Streptomyces diastatochromogenes TaxID=42236 RepID=UPI0006E29BE3